MKIFVSGGGFDCEVCRGIKFSETPKYVGVETHNHTAGGLNCPHDLRYLPGITLGCCFGSGGRGAWSRPLPGSDCGVRVDIQSYRKTKVLHMGWLLVPMNVYDRLYPRTFPRPCLRKVGGFLTSGVLTKNSSRLTGTAYLLCVSTSGLF